MVAPKTKKGAKGISLFIPYFLVKAISTRPITAPDQNANTTPESAWENPRSQPRPSASLASPSPIQVPRDRNQIAAKGKASKGWLLGFSQALSGVVLAFWSGAVIGLVLIAFTKKYGMKSEIPFAPFLVLGATIAFLFELHLFPGL